MYGTVNKVPTLDLCFPCNRALGRDSLDMDLVTVGKLPTMIGESSSATWLMAGSLSLFVKTGFGFEPLKCGGSACGGKEASGTCLPGFISTSNP